MFHHRRKGWDQREISQSTDSFQNHLKMILTSLKKNRTTHCDDNKCDDFSSLIELITTLLFCAMFNHCAKITKSSSSLNLDYRYKRNEIRSQKLVLATVIELLRSHTKKNYEVTFRSHHTKLEINCEIKIKRPCNSILFSKSTTQHN